jgi:glutamate synthase domain-containing protein 2
MAKVTIKRGDATIEAELSLTELMQLTGLNGHSGSRKGTESRISEESPVDENTRAASAETLFSALPERGRRFLHFVKMAGRAGISAEEIVSKMGLKSRYEIGGLSAGALSKQAKRYGFSIRELYKKDVASVNGVRTVLFKPGRLLQYLNQ